MPVTERFVVDVPSDLAAAVRARIAAGQFTDETAVIVSALAEAEEHRADIDAWLRGPVSKAYDEVTAGTATLYSLDEVRESLGLPR